MPDISTCQLVPPCKQNRHAALLPDRQPTPIGKYFFTEEALTHDLAALKKGEIYLKGDFYTRAKAWYKAEIDRIVHLKRVENDVERRQQSRDPYQRGSSQNEPPNAKHLSPNPSSQYRRAANPDPAPTKGDYTLAPYDYAQYLNKNLNEHHPNLPWSYVQLQGLDAAYFSMRLERAVDAKLAELRDQRQGGITIQSGGGLGLMLTGYYRPPVRCALGRTPVVVAPPFEPAGALAPGEDWRPPAAARESGLMTLPPAWAISASAATVGTRRRTSLRLSAKAAVVVMGAVAAPVAEMQISPTLGRWPTSPKGVGVGVGAGEVWEDIRDNVVVVSGLEFAVDGGL
ncbi:hypothetical protein B0T17DRAFT_656729 [Bombardia bombarda]|uniref:Uncharacterized protein n=1 Tax=Bombardia bombarda TaxID=252184 RepID=A0AA39WHQ6_9PEZI|nr:hypothetical protein B0T17DRAFT_656729 [Bombardia bombarda]